MAGIKPVELTHAIEVILRKTLCFRESRPKIEAPLTAASPPVNWFGIIPSSFTIYLFIIPPSAPCALYLTAVSLLRYSITPRQKQISPLLERGVDPVVRLGIPDRGKLQSKSVFRDR
ncbi:MAG: hypothetical protein J5907_08150 [Bacteroidales bacterium]|nr:hypothetical protein [Bacteroidales bacterium]